MYTYVYTYQLSKNTGGIERGEGEGELTEVLYYLYTLEVVFPTHYTRLHYTGIWWLERGCVWGIWGV